MMTVFLELDKYIISRREYRTSGNTSNPADYLKRHYPFLTNNESKEETNNSMTGFF